MYELKRSSVGTVLGLLVAIIAIVGTEVFGWEWGSGQLVPTMLGGLVAGIAVLFVAKRLGVLN